MKRLLATVAILLSAHAWASPSDAETSQTEWSDSVPSEIVTIQAGRYKPGSISVSNGSYRFAYGNDSLGTWQFEATAGVRLFRLLGSVYLEEGLGYMSFSGAVEGQGAPSGETSLTLHTFTLDNRLRLAFDTFPVKWIVPFIDGGYDYSFYYQGGSSELATAQGGAGNWVAGAGLRLWVNRSHSVSRDYINQFLSFPLYIVARVNRVFPSDSSLDLGDTNLMAGVGLGF